MDEFMLKYILNIFISILLIFAIITFIQTLGINLNTTDPPKKLIQVVTIEGLEPTSENIITGANSICETYKGSSKNLNNACDKLTNRNCNATSCCVFTSNNKCAAGNANGPIYNTDNNGKTNNLDYYYYQNKCYGNKCPK